ncbi:methionine ABC transporter permease [Telmatospirillum sp. J64-1]|uniref:methionine ABC transporter permease n=1 Tax=Telmatospirillum sp. J64-1 TaxID=2502183 RepID=UPI00115F40D4|nr:methionine ABC transporter permease [Telmatospirillum sp. J64-1]
MSPMMIELLLDAFIETLIMVGVSGVIGAGLGIPLGVLLVATGPKHILPNKAVNKIVGTVANIIRSTPFIILLVAIIPFTRFVVGTSIGTPAAIVPLSLIAIPFVGRLVESSIREVDAGLIEAAQAMGATPFQIVVKVLLPEAMPSIIAGLTITVVSLINYSAMAGAVGGGGLGDLGIRYGYQRFQPEVMAAVIVILIILVQAVQTTGDWLAVKLNKRKIQ